MSKCCGILAKTESWTSNSTIITRKISPPPIEFLPSHRHGKVSCMKIEKHAQRASACAILHANHDVSEPISCSQFPWLPSFWVSTQTWGRERVKRGKGVETIMVVEVRWRKGGGGTQDDGGETLWSRGQRQTRQADACGVGKKKKKALRWVCFCLRPQGEQVSESWSSGCHDYLHEPGIYVVNAKKKKAEEVQKSSAAGHVLYHLLDFSALSESLRVSQQELLVQFGFHGDSRERYVLFKQRKKWPVWSLVGFSVVLSESVFGLLTRRQTFTEPQTSPWVFLKSFNSLLFSVKWGETGWKDELQIEFFFIGDHYSPPVDDLR